MAIKPLNFDPEDPNVKYSSKFLAIKSKRYPDRMPKLQGPYWYAFWYDEEHKIHSQYLGKNPPPEVQKHLNGRKPTNTWRRRPVTEIPVEYSIEPLRQALDQNNQIVIDIPQISRDCMAYFQEVQPGKFLVYR